MDAHRVIGILQKKYTSYAHLVGNSSPYNKPLAVNQYKRFIQSSGSYIVVK